MHAASGLNQLGSDAHAIAALPNRAFEHIADAKVTANLLHIDRLSLVGESRIAGDHEKPADLGERRCDFLDHAVGKVLLLWIAAHVLERQYRDRRLVRKCKSWRSSLTRLTPLAFGTLSRIAGEGGPRRACDGVGEGCAHAVDPHRPCDV